jgi:hypothetical protein
MVFSFSRIIGFDVADLSEDSPDDVEGLDSSAAHVANLLSTEPADSMVPRHFLFIYFLHTHSYQAHTRYGKSFLGIYLSAVVLRACKIFLHACKGHT